MQTRAEWMREVDMLLADTAHKDYARSKTLNVAATAFILGTNADQVRKIMRAAGYQGAKIGKPRLYDKSSVYDVAKKIGILS